jgi:predicted phage terminase large subunit-like protein
MYSGEAIGDLRRERGEAYFATQYQQNPTAAHGQLIKPEHIDYFDTCPPNANQITFSIDTAVKVSEDASYTVVLVIASDGWRHYVSDVLRSRLDILETFRAVADLIQRHGRRRILIEDASSGPGLARMLQEGGFAAELWPTRGRNKMERLEAHLHMFAQSRILVRANQPWTVPLVNEWVAFPSARHDDQVDAITQYLDWAASRPVVRPVIMGAGGYAGRAAATLFRQPSRVQGHPMRPRNRPGPPARRW